MKNRKRLLAIILIGIVLIVGGAAAYGHRNTYRATNDHSSSTGSAAGCPSGYVYYGQPLNKCVTQQYYDQCFGPKPQTESCPL